MKKFTIISEEVFDHSDCIKPKHEEENLCLGSIEVHLELCIEENKFLLNFQASNTWDIGAISSILKPYDGDQGYCDLKRYIDDICEFDDLLDAIKKESKVDALWEEYVERNYIRNKNHYDGMDANSEHSNAKKIAKNY